MVEGKKYKLMSPGANAIRHPDDSVTTINFPKELYDGKCYVTSNKSESLGSGDYLAVGIYNMSATKHLKVTGIIACGSEGLVEIKYVVGAPTSKTDLASFNKHLGKDIDTDLQGISVSGLETGAITISSRVIPSPSSNESGGVVAEALSVIVHPGVTVYAKVTPYPVATTRASIEIVYEEVEVLKEAPTP